MAVLPVCGGENRMKYGLKFYKRHLTGGSKILMCLERLYIWKKLKFYPSRS